MKENKKQPSTVQSCLTQTCYVCTFSKVSTMAFSSWFARFRSSSRPIYSSSSLLNFILKKQSRTPLPSTAPAEAASYNQQTHGGPRILSWASSSLLPVALAVSVSAGTLVFQSQNNPSLCDASNLDHRC